MLYPSIYISGNIISQELIDKLDDDSAEGQRPSDFGLESGTRVRQDIARAWTDANDYWKIFKRKLDALKETEKGTTETRNLWTIPLLSLLGYDLRFQQQSEIINEKTYEISHRAGNRGDFPVMIVSAKEELDKKLKTFLEKNKYTCEVVLLDEINGNDFINKVSESWSGAIPATLITKNNKSTQDFIEKKVTYDYLIEKIK